MTQTKALESFTEAPIRQGGVENPWEGLVAGTVLGEKQEAMAILRAAVRDVVARRMRLVERRTKPEWSSIVREAERILGRKWKQMAESYGDWGRDGTLAVATRELGWRMVKAVKEIKGLRYAAADGQDDPLDGQESKGGLGSHRHLGLDQAP